VIRRAELLSPALAGAAALWAHAHRPGALPGLAIAEALTLALWPLILLAVVFGIPAASSRIIPARWRRAYRRRYTRESQRSARIPAWLRRSVLAADRYRCAHCGYAGELQVDHVFPWSLGGMTCLWNLVTLCGTCNRAKSNYWRYRSGLVIYRAFAGYDVPALAEQILASERRRRWSPLRWLLAAWSLG
jgi:HNH endonuclease